MISSKTTLSIIEILEYLDESFDHEIQVHHSTDESAELFRVRMYQSKRKWDRLQLDIGFKEEDDVKKMICKKSKTDNLTTLTFYFSKRDTEIKYEVILITKDTDNHAG